MIITDDQKLVYNDDDDLGAESNGFILHEGSRGSYVAGDLWKPSEKFPVDTGLD